MIDRIVMACPKCGSKEGSVCLVTDPLLEERHVIVNRVGYANIQAECFGCGYYSCKRVYDQGLWNLLRVVAISDKPFAEGVRSETGLNPTLWKQWRVGARIGLSDLRLRHSMIRQCLTVGIPDGWAYFNKLRSPRRNLRRSLMKAWMDDRLLLPEWRALRYAVLKESTESITSLQLSRYLSNAMVGS